MSNIPGQKVIKEILSGNEKLLKQVYKKVYTSIERYALATNTSVNNAKEAVQDAFEVFYRQALNDELNLDCSLETYIISIARRVLLKEERDWSGRLKDAVDTDEEIDDTDDLESKKIQEQKHRLFNDEFNKLSKECRTIISLTLQGYSSTDINEVMNYQSEDFVKIKRSRCKRYLIEKIKENPDYEKLRDANPEDHEFPLWGDEQSGEDTVRTRV